ncbi:MAG: ribonuclease P protein component [Edaphocola sp.]
MEMHRPRIYERYTLKAAERLKLRKQIETLFQRGEAFSVLRLRVVYLLAAAGNTAAGSPVRVGFSIPKKRLKKAVQRNRVRRLLREAWRHQKHDLYAQVPAGQQLQVFLIYTYNDVCTFEDAQTSVNKCLYQLSKRLVAPPGHG